MTFNVASMASASAIKGYTDQDPAFTRFLSKFKKVCPVCDEQMRFIHRPAIASSIDPLAARASLSIKCKCIGLVNNYEHMRSQDREELVHSLFDSVDEHWHKRYGEPQHGKTKEEWYKYMWRFEHNAET